MPQPTTFEQLTEQETAVVRVNGVDLYNWETVFVQHRWAEAFPIFRFTCAEDTPVPNAWTQTQFKPGDECAIYLGKQLAISGIILVRQTSYNATQHGVMLQGVGLTWLAARASHLDETGSFDNMTYQQIVEKVLAPFETKPVFVGEPNATPFKQAQIQPGETIWDFFERLGRDVGIIVGSDQYGNMVFISDHAGDTTATLLEGENIKSCVATISIENRFNLYVVRTQQPGGDDVSGAAANEMEAIAPGKLSHYSPLLTPAEQHVTPPLLELRAANEAKWHEGTIVQAIIEVQGWFRPDGSSLWMIGDGVDLQSPSAMITERLVIQTATFTQDIQRGTITTLELVAPWLLNDQSWYDLTEYPPPGDAKTNTQPATTPPAAKANEPPANNIE